MKTYVPNYYKKFSCIAEKCKHNCCIGWEIDIDDDTNEYYQNINGSFGERLKNNISVTDDCACFKLDGKGRCVFLNNNNLCDIILNLGEDALCQICADHPRFRNFFPNRIEMGLGICCEEACRIILSQEEKLSFEVLLSNNEKDSGNINELNDFYTFRNNLFKIIEDSTLSIKEKKKKLLAYTGYDFPEKTVSEWVDIYLSLERLDDYWTILLNDLKEVNIESIALPKDFNLYFQNLIKYFVFRYTTNNCPDLGVILALSSENIITYLCKMHVVKYKEITFEDMVEYARMYSCEIEYSDKNIEELTSIQ